MPSVRHRAFVMSALRDFSNALKARDPRYFTRLPFSAANPSRDFDLPYDHDHESDKRRQLLWHLFDLVRNGLSHRYLQLGYQLKEGSLGFGVTGAGFKQPLGPISAILKRGQRPKKFMHLSFRPSKSRGGRCTIRLNSTKPFLAGLN